MHLTAKVRTSQVLGLLCVTCACTFAHEPDARVPTSHTSTTEHTQCIKGNRKPPRLLFGIVGFWGTKRQEEAFQPVADYLSKRLGLAVVLVSANEYDELVAQIIASKVDIALLPPVAYVKAKATVPCLKLLRTMVVGGRVHYSGYIIVSAQSPITRPGDLVGRRIAFVERSSASGYLFALEWLKSHGVSVESSEHTFLGSHGAVIEAVISGKADAGATFQGALESARRNGVDTGSLRILGITGRIPMDALVAASDLDSSLLEQLQEALDALNTATPEGRAALAGLIGVVGFARTDDHFYDDLRTVIRQASNGGDGL